MSIDHQIELLRRGTSAIISESELALKLQEGRCLRVKLGVDPTAADVTLGWAVVFRKLRDFQKLGHTACLIIGDFTARIGDPSGKSKTRPQLTLAEIQKNVDSVLTQIFKILEKDKTEIYYNSEWLSQMSFEDVIKLASKYTVARILERDDFAKRLKEERPIAMHEILYPLCQGYDSVKINADIELGGNDQLFNNLVGRTLMGQFEQSPQLVMLCPLLMGTDGKEKMSQSLGNYVSVVDAPNDMYGKTMSIPDHLIENWLELTTDVPMEEIREIVLKMSLGELNPRDAKRRLACELVTLYHSSEAAGLADQYFLQTFSQRKQPLEAVEVSLPEEFSVQAEISIPHLIAKLQLSKSSSEARRLMLAGAVSLDSKVIKDPSALLKCSDLREKVLRVGKHKFVKLI